ncbi:hypothetical protein H2248_011967 [Termitomyces sp. 'cryptogamus']|nr:hypothetical protein H2248_011967 [Termitomyces sp. 'cryptogamus']
MLARFEAFVAWGSMYLWVDYALQAVMIVLPNALPNFPNPCLPSAPTLGNSDASPTNPDDSLANSNAFSAVIDTSPESLELSPTVSDPVICLQPPLPWFPNLPQNIMMTPEQPASPADPIRISL